MSLQRDVSVAVGLLTGLAFVVALGAAGLLVRMGPAIETILERNGRSLEAGEEILRVLLVTRPGAVTPEAQAALDGALVRARQFVTEPEEGQIVAHIEQLAPRAIRGDDPARAQVADALATFAEVNRNAMRRADEQARRFSSGGAWGVVFLGLAAAVLSTAVSRRLRRRAVEPLAALDGALDAYLRGDRHRRVAALDACDDIRRLGANVNRLLDADMAKVSGVRPSKETGTDRAVLLHLLDAFPEPTVVADDTGGIVAANQQALGLLGADDGDDVRRALRAALERAAQHERGDARAEEALADSTAAGPRPAGEAAPDGDDAALGRNIRVTRVSRADLWICAMGPRA